MATPPATSRDFRLFWAGQAVSELGTAFTLFALPLLVFELTGSALDLALATAASFLPYALFGLVIGAWVDRLERKRVLIAADLARAATIATIPALAGLGLLPVWWIYAASFAVSTLSIAFAAASFAAVPSLVAKETLVAANSRLTIGAQTAHVIGPLLAGALLAAGIPTANVLYADAATFLASAASVALIAIPSSGGRDAGSRPSIRAEVAEGVRYVFAHPVLRNLALLSALVNFTIATQWSQLVLFAKERLDAGDGEIGVLWAAGSAGVVVFALGAPRILRRVGLGRAVLGAVGASGIATVALAATPWLWPAVGIWALRVGLGQFAGIATTSFRQAVTPPSMLGRVQTVGQVLSWSAIPAGALAGGWAITAVGDVAAVYAGTGVAGVALAVAFGFTTVGRGREDVLQAFR